METEKISISPVGSPSTPSQIVVEKLQKTKIYLITPTIKVEKKFAQLDPLTYTSKTPPPEEEKKITPLYLILKTSPG